MYAMQYVVDLPADYDMQIIRRRVADTGHRMDGFPGLEFKAFLVREKARGAPLNVYAPFYVWRDVDGMRAFCWGEPGYSAIVRDFGRRPIQDWTVDSMNRGPQDFADAKSLTIAHVPLTEDVPPSQSVPGIAHPFLTGLDEHCIARLVAVDVTSWSLILSELSSRDARQDEPGSVGYEVLHVSTASS